MSIVDSSWASRADFWAHMANLTVVLWMYHLMHTGHAGRSCGLTVALLDSAGWTLAFRHMRIGRTGRSLDVCSIPVTHAYWARGAILAFMLLRRDLSWIHPSSSSLGWLVRESVSLINPGINPSYGLVATGLSCGCDMRAALVLSALTPAWIRSL